MRIRSAVILVVLVTIALIAAGCPDDRQTGDDDDGTLVARAEPAEQADSEAETAGAGPTDDAAEVAKPEAADAESGPEQAAPQEKEGESMPDETLIVIKTTKGDITARLYPNEAPKTVANLLSLAKEGYYDDMVWHRVEPGFVIQVGEGQETPNIPDEVNRHKHRKGALAMAKLGSMTPGRLSEPGSASSQFYITMCSGEQAEHLNDEYTVFGQVTEGMDVAEEITTEDRIKTIEIVSGGE